MPRKKVKRRPRAAAPRARNRALPWLAAGAGVAALLVAVYFGARMLGQEGSGADADDPELVALGERVYAEQCAACHGVNLEGQADWRKPLATGGFPAPPHDAKGHTWHHPDAVLFEMTRSGGQASAPAGFKSTWPARIRARQQQINDRAG